MKYLNIIFLLLSSNFVFSMEAERKSLASFFDIDTFYDQDITQVIAQQYLSDKQWWYVDKEIQYDHQCCHNDPWLYRNTTEGVKIKNSFYNVHFNKSGTEIVAWPNHMECYPICVWDRESGIELERIGADDYKKAKSSSSYDTEIWTNNRLYSLSHIHELSENEFFWRWKHASYDGTGIGLVITKSCQFIVRVDGSRVEPFYLMHGGLVNTAYFNPCGIEIITASEDQTMRLWHKKTGQELLRIVYDSSVVSAWFNEMGTEIAVATEDGKIRILAKYHTDNLPQILLKKLLHLWLQLEKPDKEIDSSEKLLEKIAQLLSCKWQALHDAWVSFPEYMQTALWLSTHKKIQKYGK
jgi:hypothetical protein